MELAAATLLAQVFGAVGLARRVGHLELLDLDESRVNSRDDRKLSHVDLEPATEKEQNFLTW